MRLLAFAAAFVAWLSVLLAALSAGQHAPVAWPAAFALVAIGAAMVSRGAGLPFQSNTNHEKDTLR